MSKTGFVGAEPASSAEHVIPAQARTQPGYRPRSGPAQVIPAKAGIRPVPTVPWVPALARTRALRLPPRSGTGSRAGFAGCGFTMVELLCVVAIAGILAAIAIPNFLEAQTRCKLARVHMELAGLKLALGDYYADHRAYPPAPPTPEPEQPAQQKQAPSQARAPYPYYRTPYQGPYPPSAMSSRQPRQPTAPEETSVPSPLEALTSPVAYIPSLPLDAFNRPWRYSRNRYVAPYQYQLHLGEAGEGIYIDAPGLRGYFLFSLWSYGPDQAGNTVFAGEVLSVLNYDSSNGTTSSGDVIVCGP